MISAEDFEEIRPYKDAEVPAVVKRLIQNPLTYKLLQYLFPKATKERLMLWGARVQTIRDLQMQFSHPAIRGIVNRTTKGLFFSGFEYLEAGKGYLFVSNHRDILLDSALLNVLLVEHGMDTCETGTGDNLMFSDFISDLMRVNKSYIIHRTVTGKDMYLYSLRLSNYIRHQVSEKKVSMWIAQQNGRAKDGIDQTETGLLKMLGLSEPDFLKAYSELNMVPMAISYEYDPCDNLKAKERYIVESGIPYEKKRKDDLKSMLAGITDPKGRVHLALTPPIVNELEGLSEIQPKNARFRAFVQLVDSRIIGAFRLWPTHYMGADLLANTRNYTDHYTLEQEKAFETYIAQRLKGIEGDKGRLRELMLEIYANPLRQKEQLSKGE